jgi:branched-chain amino acid transport system ATP-binding protein
MAEMGDNEKKHSTGYHGGTVDTVISVEEVNRRAAAIAAAGVAPERIAALGGPEPYVTIEGLRAGYGKMEILHDFNLSVGRGQSLCLIGPNGAGKSTILHSIFGFTDIYGGTITVGGQDVTRLSAKDKLRRAGVAYILQDKSVFPAMTVEENLWMGGYLMAKPAQAKAKAEAIFARYPRLAERRNHPARVLSGGERRLLEISRALVMEPEWSSRSSTSCSTARARPSSWSSRTPRRAWSSPTSATSWSPASSPWPAPATSCSPTRRSAASSSAASGRAIITPSPRSSGADAMASTPSDLKPEPVEVDNSDVGAGARLGVWIAAAVLLAILIFFLFGLG